MLPVRRYCWVVMFVCAACLGSARAGDWPMYKKDAHRSSVSDEALDLPMRAAWVYRAAQPPRPAWPEPVKVMNRLEFDYAFQPVIAGGLVCFGSSADDTVRALDAATGAAKWRFTTGGPVRLAPQIAGGKVYFASDDGYAYCVTAADGKLAWRFRAAPADERVIGNERMICRWPCRTGVLVEDGVAYTTAGMWSSEGVYVYALDAATGDVLWCNDTSHIVSDVRTLHMGADFAPYGVCPQGALLATDDKLLAPTGKGLPAAYDRRTGRLLYHRMDAKYNQRGGTWVTIDGDKFYTQPHVWSFRLDDGAIAGAHWSRRYPVYKARVPGKAYSVYQKASAVVTGGKVCGRLAYDLALTGGMLIEGRDGAVAALDAQTEKELWRAEVEGQARGIAVADGRLFVATDSGALYCFVGAKADAPATVTVIEPEAGRRVAPAPDAQVAAALEALARAGIDRGYVLVLGDPGGRYAEAIASAGRLHVVSVLADERAAGALREQFLGTTALYGSRIHVRTLPDPRVLPFPPYFANAVVIAGPVDGLSAKDIYRVLHPCGGLLLTPGLPATDAARFVEQTGAPEAEGAKASVVRGKLSGALDWDSDFTLDKRVKWPLRLTWFGGPGPAMVTDRKQFTPFGPVANGRYFVYGQDTVIAVDAYNGAILWTRPVPPLVHVMRLIDDLHATDDFASINGRNYGRWLTVGGESVYLATLGYFHTENRERVCVRMDARTGAQTAIYGAYAPPETVSLADKPSWTVEVDEAHSGTLSMARDGDALTITLTTQDPAASPLDRWDLFFDVRPEPARYGLYGCGTFLLKVQLAASAEAAPALARGTGTHFPKAEVTGARTGAATATTVRIPWAELDRLSGAELQSFDFGARLLSHDGGEKEPVARRYLFCDVAADWVNNGWARVWPGKAPAEGAAPRPAVFAGSIKQAPKARYFRWDRLPPRLDAGSPLAASRRHPLTGDIEPKLFQGGTFGCGGSSYSAYCVVKRSTAIGIYDFGDDSGMRTFDGVKGGCVPTTVAALGMLLSSEGRGGCECTTNFQCSLGLAPVETRRNEDWALYYDLDAGALIRRGALNLGAPGDRRAEDGVLWLGFPRMPGGIGAAAAPVPAGAVGLGKRTVPGNIGVPLRIEGSEGAGPLRINADRRPIDGTDKPWVYASCYRGIRKATLSLGAERTLEVAPAPVPPTLDGALAEGEWPEEPQAELAASHTKVFVTSDGENLYFAATRPPVIHRKGEVVPWNMRQGERDSLRDKDAGWEVFLSDGKSPRVIHLAVLVAGMQHDAVSDDPAAPREDRSWDGDWRSAIVANENELTVEMAVPWKTLADAGLDRSSLAVNLMMSGPWRNSDALRVLGGRGRDRCGSFVPLELGDAAAEPAPRRFTVRLHFAELDDVAPGERVFDVKLHGKTVLRGLDVAKEAGGVRKALVKELHGVTARDAIELEFVPAAQEINARTEPILNALEFAEEP